MSVDVRLTLLRGVCQTPAYVAHELGYFAEEGLQTSITIVPTAWMVPGRLMAGETDAAVIPWTRVAQAAVADEPPLKLICGSGSEEAAVVIRNGMDVHDVASVAVPREGGMKDLTAMALVESLGWTGVRQLRFPSGDAAIISFLGGGVDAAAMVEPFATLCEDLGMGRVVRRTGDVWAGAPGCSLAVPTAWIEEQPEATAGLVRAFSRGAAYASNHRGEAARISSPYIGVAASHIENALAVNRPDVHALRNETAMRDILQLMIRLGYIERMPNPFLDLRFLEQTIPA